MTEKLLSEGDVKELEDESIVLWEEGPLGITKDLLRDLDRALATIRALQAREGRLREAFARFLDLYADHTDMVCECEPGDRISPPVICDYCIARQALEETDG